MSMQANVSFYIAQKILNTLYMYETNRFATYFARLMTEQYGFSKKVLNNKSPYVNIRSKISRP
jgi:hypothetical protein